MSDLNPFMQAVGTVNEDLRNPFEAAAADLVNGEKAQLSSSMQLAKTGSADDHARALKASQKTGIPVDVVKTDLKQVEQDIEEHEFDYDALYQETPKTASFLMNPDNAGIAHDDVCIIYVIHCSSNNLCCRCSGGSIGTSGCNAGVPGPAITKNVAVVRVWLTF